MSASLVSQFDVGLFDLDGVCYLGPEAVAYAPESMTKAINNGLTIAYVTNNAGRTPDDVAAHLVSLGIPATPESVITAGMVAAGMLAAMVEPGAPVLVMGAPALRLEVEKAGLRVVESADDAPSAVIQGFTPEASWESLSEAALAIRAGAIYFATNLDTTIPRDRGLMIGNGALVRAVTTSTGVEPYSAGKPRPEIFQAAAKNTGAQRPFAVGDNLDTDIQGAIAADIPVLHVLTGLATAREVCLAIPEQRPNFLGDDLRVLHECYPEQLWDGEWAISGNARVRWDGTTFVAGDQPVASTLDLDTYRALARAAWAAVDAGAPREAVAAAIPELSVVRQ